MAVLEKIRVKLGVFITVVIALALLSFIVDPSTLEMTMNSFSSKYDVGEIDGESINIEDYQKKVDYYTHIYTLTTGNQSVPEEALESIYETSWQDLKNEMLIIPAIREAGVRIGEEELFDLSQGKEISPLIAQEQMFLDETGNFSRRQFIEFIQAISTDPSGNLGTYWSFLERNMQRQQYFTKYNSLLSQSNVLNPVELRRNIEDNNVTSEADFIIVPFGFEQDSTIVVSSREVEQYYAKHKEQYKQTASRDVEFVAYEVVPSERDLEFAKESLNKVFEDFKSTTNLRAFLAANSDTPLQNYYYAKGELGSEYPEVEEFVFNTKNPTVLPIFQKGNSYVAAKINDTKLMSDSVFVQHILLPETETKKADSLLLELRRGKNFSAMATEHSLDSNPNVENPGDIGWITQTMMIPGMESVLYSPLNRPFVLNTDYGVHVVKVTKKTPSVKKIQVALLTKEAISSKETFQTYYSKANDLASRTDGKIENFDKIVSEESLPVVPANNIEEGAKMLSRYEGTKEIARWIYEAEKGDVSPIITIDNKYFFVVAVKEIREEGYVPVNDVAFAIKSTLTREKKGEKMSAEIKEQISALSTMEEIATALNTTVSKRDDIAFGSLTAQSFDPVLVGAIAGAPVGEIKGPVVGNVGVYILKVNERETGSFYTDQDAQMRANQMQSYQMNMLPVVFDDIGEVKDNRARFF